MSINNKVKLNTHYTRSVNIERDASSEAVVRSYIPTSRAVRTLERVANSFGEKQAPRAWSLIGPYGSGKSSFSIFLNHLVGNPGASATQEAYKVLAGEGSLSSRFKKENKGSKGYFKVLLSGAPEPLSRRLVQTLYSSAVDYWSALPGTKPKVIGKLKKASKQDEIAPNQILNYITELQDALEGKSKGILLVIDELGKFLEYEARHYGVNDIFLLQILAEHACSENQVNLYVFAMLHQSFEQYAKGLGEALKKEWAKIQGRFEDIPFLEGPEQTLRVASKAFSHDFTPKEKDLVKSRVAKVVGTLEKESALPGVLDKDSAIDLFTSCYPLHPVTGLLLPVLCQKIAQNERTLFSFLGSDEPSGLKRILEDFSSVEELVMPHHIFDYFILNQPASIGDHLTHRRWVEVITAIERVGDVTFEEMSLLKTIGLLNIIGAHGGLKASKNLLKSLYSKSVSTSLKTLEERSVVQFRRFSSEYRVWQGSDFDIELALQEELSNLGQFSLSEILNSRANLLPIVARRYTIESGTLRYYSPVFIDAQSYKTLPSNDTKPRALFYLSLGKDDEQLFEEKVCQHFGDLDVIALCKNAVSLREAVAEVEALDKVRVTRQELNSDPVAMREYQDRLDAAEYTEQMMLRELSDSPELSSWYWSSKQLEVNNKRQFQEQLSKVLGDVYHASPVIHNELINRDKPSSQAVGARGKLLQAMLVNSHKRDLGIEKNPPEKSIYNSLIKATGLHSKDSNGEWALSEPSLDGRKHKQTQFHKVWTVIKEFIENTEKQSKSLGELDKILVAPPFGVKAGLLPILYVSACLVYKDEIAIYENRRFIPILSYEQIERFVKRPDEFEVQYFKIEGVKKSIFSELNLGLFNSEDGRKQSGETRTVLDIVKPLAKFMAELPEYTKKTKQLSKEAIAVRTAFNLSKSPVKLLFEELPKALGYEVDREEGSFDGFSNEIMEVFRELKYASEKLKEREVKLLANALGFPKYSTLKDLRADISGKVAGLEGFTVDVSGVKAFLKRLAKRSDSDELWLESLFVFLGHKPIEKWSDSDQSQAEYRLAQYAQQINDLHKLWLQHNINNKSGNDDFEVILLRSIKRGQGELDAVATINKDCSRVINQTKGKLFEELRALEGKEMQLAAISELVNDFLSEYKESSQLEKSEAKTSQKKEA
ncbi:hypothetical protein [Kangiella sediminilitoris]|uniref:ATP-binding protein n=1 Tax=Kangiella sediminilitoris TaxID=1144748 RepID=A0A1B3B9L9_9GAMM|nr:hypothetical protein [Kangiella sediminilitoris]AOE49511.1 hypothetical protein KS2013_787 [Kangiella sediminilitoris]